MIGVILMLAIIAIFLVPLIRATKVNSQEAESRPKEPGSISYPYKPGIEFRLSNGQITTRGYAATHPEQFSHWQCGRCVMGEVIDLTDWENWYVNYFGIS